jgi:endonuclease-3
MCHLVVLTENGAGRTDNNFFTAARNASNPLPIWPRSGTPKDDNRVVFRDARLSRHCQYMCNLVPRVPRVLEHVFDQYGRPQHPGSDDLLGTLVRTILSQNTTRQNTDRAFEQLLDRYGGDWDQMRRAPTQEVEETIEVAGLAGQKAPRIQHILQHLHNERGSCSLEFLRKWDVDRARSYLVEFKGVGPKTAAFTLMNAADMPLFPMDTHIFRICERLGWIDQSLSSDRAHTMMREAIPDDLHYPAHVVMVRHGRETCHARAPDCTSCSLLDICEAGQEYLE